MLSDDDLRQRLRDGEADHVERTVSLTNSDKFGEAICSFANDLSGRGEIGVLFIGVKDNGDCANVVIEERHLRLGRTIGRQYSACCCAGKTRAGGFREPMCSSSGIPGRKSAT